MRDFRNLRVYQDAMDLVTNIYRFSSLLPDSERFGLRSQMQRAAVSIASNIAEGARGSDRDFARFLKYSLGSANEIECQLEICDRLYQLNSTKQLATSIKTLEAKIGALIKSLKKPHK